MAHHPQRVADAGVLDGHAADGLRELHVEPYDPGVFAQDLDAGGFIAAAGHQLQGANPFGELSTVTSPFDLGQELGAVSGSEVGRERIDPAAEIDSAVLGPAVELLEDVIGEDVDVVVGNLVDTERRYPRAGPGGCGR